VSQTRTFEDGFTLVEILMVVFIIGLSSGVGIMNLPERASQLQEAADIVTGDVTTLQKRAVLTGAPHAIEVSADGYQGLVWQSGEWRPIGLQGREFGGAVRVNIESEIRRDQEITKIVFDPTGAPDAGLIVLSAKGSRIEISPYSSAWERSP